jgi:hypothetical protein
MTKSEGNGHTPKVQPITDEALNALAKEMGEILTQALHEALQNRKEDLFGKGKTVADLVATVENASFRTSLSEFLLRLKIDALLAGLQHPPLDLINEAEYQEIHAYLERLWEQAHRFPDKPSAGSN